MSKRKRQSTRHSRPPKCALNSWVANLSAERREREDRAIEFLDACGRAVPTKSAIMRHVGVHPSAWVNYLRLQAKYDAAVRLLGPAKCVLGSYIASLSAKRRDRENRAMEFLDACGRVVPTQSRVMKQIGVHPSAWVSYRRLQAKYDAAVRLYGRPKTAPLASGRLSPSHGRKGDRPSETVRGRDRQTPAANRDSKTDRKIPVPPTRPARTRFQRCLCRPCVALRGSPGRTPLA